MRGIQWIVLCGFAFAHTIVVAPARAADIARDTADDPTYAKRPAWSSGENGGKGFKGWNLVAQGDPADHRGFVIGDSREINSDINSPAGFAFGIFATGKGCTAEAYRTFEAPLDVSQSFSVDLAGNFRNGLKGIDLRAPASEGEPVIFNFTIGADDYVVHKAATENGPLGSAYDAKTAFTLRFTQTEANAGTWSIVRRGGIHSEKTGRYEGRAAGIKFFVLETDEGKENGLWLDNLVITAAGGS